MTDPPAEMHALRVPARGDAEDLVYETAPIPEPAIGDVLIRVAAASFTPTELTWPSTWTDRAGHDRAPVIPAHEVSGTVAKLGFGTSGFEVGDRVYGLTDWYRDGAAAEYVVVEARNLAPIPETLDDLDAAAVPMPALTAQQALFTHGALASGHAVLVVGAGGGVGAFAIQLARTVGARVIACARGWAREPLLELGADRFVDLDREPLANGGEVDLVFDLAGGDLLGDSWSLVRPGGSVVSVVEDPAARSEAREDARSAAFVVEPNGSELAALASKLEAGELRPIVGDVRPLAEGRDAFLAKRSGGILGKSVLRVAGR